MERDDHDPPSLCSSQREAKYLDSSKRSRFRFRSDAVAALSSLAGDSEANLGALFFDLLSSNQAVSSALSKAGFPAATEYKTAFAMISNLKRAISEDRFPSSSPLRAEIIGLLSRDLSSTTCASLLGVHRHTVERNTNKFVQSSSYSSLLFTVAYNPTCNGSSSLLSSKIGVIQRYWLTALQVSATVTCKIRVSPPPPPPPSPSRAPRAPPKPRVFKQTHPVYWQTLTNSELYEQFLEEASFYCSYGTFVKYRPLQVKKARTADCVCQLCLEGVTVNADFLAAEALGPVPSDLAEKFKELKEHKRIVKVQRVEYRRQLSSLRFDEALLVLDFSSCPYPQEKDSSAAAFFGRKAFPWLCAAFSVRDGLPSDRPFLPEPPTHDVPIDEEHLDVIEDRTVDDGVLSSREDVRLAQGTLLEEMKKSFPSSNDNDYNGGLRPPPQAAMPSPNTFLMVCSFLRFFEKSPLSKTQVFSRRKNTTINVFIILIPSPTITSISSATKETTLPLPTTLTLCKRHFLYNRCRNQRKLPPSSKASTLERRLFQAF